LRIVADEGERPLPREPLQDVPDVAVVGNPREDEGEGREDEEGGEHADHDAAA
jgi:hypothetical protein